MENSKNENDKLSEVKYHNLSQLMIGYHKLGFITYHNFSEVMISYDRFEGVFPNWIFFAFFCFFKDLQFSTFLNLFN